MIIHGDNLEVLKALLPQYEGKIDCIYIDPPYNTGNEGWVYNDNVNDPRIKKWLGEVVGKEGEDLTRHDKWLCMMYPRLRLLHRLLASTGVIFISIDDNEQANLKLICDEIFGSRCFLAEFVVKRIGGRQDSKNFAVTHEYCIAYAKEISQFSSGKKVENISSKDYPYFDEASGRYYKTQLLRKWGSNSLRENRPNLYYAITGPEGEDIFPMIYKKSLASTLGFEEIQGCWRWSASTLKRAKEEGKIEFKKDEWGHWIPYERVFMPREDSKCRPFDTWQDGLGSGATAFKNIIPESNFDYPKSISLLESILQMSNCPPNGIVLDSFAGSGTTAHAVLNLNKRDGGNRRFILCEMMDYADTITAERVKRVIDGYGEGKKAVEGTGGSFTYYELGEPLMINGNLNSDVSVDRVREYIWFTETGEVFTSPTVEGQPYFLGITNHTAYHFLYEPYQAMTLDYRFLSRLTKETVSDQQVVYADACLLSEQELRRFNITFKKIPRDITRL